MANRARQTGSAFTAWTISTGSRGGSGVTSKILALCQEVSHRSPQPVTGAVEVHPLNYLRPTEIIVPRAITHGEITLTVLETFDKSIWGTLKEVFETNDNRATLAGIKDLADFFTWMMTDASMNSDAGSALSLQRVVRNPNSDTWRVKTFENARIIDVRDDESVTVDSLVNPLTMTVWYTKLKEEPLGNRTNDPVPVPDPVPWS
jgi:hypothetical protein